MTSRKPKPQKKKAKKATKRVLAGGLDKSTTKSVSPKKLREARGEPKGGKCYKCKKKVTGDDYCFGCQHHVCKSCVPPEDNDVGGVHSVQDHWKSKPQSKAASKPEPKAAASPKPTLDAATTPQAPERKGIDPNKIPVPSRDEWNAVMEKTAKVGELSRKESQTKAAHKAAKDLLDQAQEELNDLLTELQDINRHSDKLPFPNTPAEKLSIAADKPAAAPDAWKAASIDALNLGPALTELLKQRAINTLGDLSAVMEKGGQDWYKELRGVGVGKAEKISDALAQYWKDHPAEVKTAPAASEQTKTETVVVNPGAPDSTLIVDLPLEQRLKDLLAKPAAVTLQGGHGRLKAEWKTVGDIRQRKLGQMSGGEGSGGEINAGRLASIPGISPADESAIEDAINKWSSAPSEEPAKPEQPAESPSQSPALVGVQDEGDDQ